MESTKLLELVKNKRISELKEKIVNIDYSEQEKEHKIFNLENEILELKQELKQVKENIKLSNNENGNDKKITEAIEKLEFLLKCVDKMNGSIEKSTYISTVEEVLNNKLKEKEEIKQTLEKDLIEKEVKKINEKFEFAGTKRNSMRADFNSLKVILRNESMINKNNEYNLELIKIYCEKLEKIRKIDDKIDAFSDDIKWIRNNEILPEVFEKETIERLIEEKKAILEFLEEKNKRLKDINDEINKKNKEVKNIKNQIKMSKPNNLNKKQTIEEEIEKIQEAESLTALGLNMEEAAEEIKNNIIDYIVVPVNDGVEKVFDYKKKVKIQVDGNNIENTYNAETIVGVINSNYIISNENIAMLIPLDKIEEENIVKVDKEGKITLKKFNLPEEAKIIKEKSNEIKIEEQLDIINYDKEEINLSDKIKEFLGENFTENKKEYECYKKLEDKKQNIITLDDIKRISAILEAIHGNYFKIKDRELIVDGKKFDLKEEFNKILKEPEKKNMILEELRNRGFSAEEKVLNHLKYLEKKNTKEEKTLEDICKRIDEFTENPQKNIDDIYKELLKKYITENDRARAFYNDEKYTQVEINGKKLNIKPKLPESNEELYKTFSRKSEDKIYKVMKTAAICNKIAHLYMNKLKRESYNTDKVEDSKVEISDENKELKYDKNLLLNRKVKLMKTAINMSKKNKYISVGKVSDNRGEGMAMDIPGYTTIVLHVPKRDVKLLKPLKQYRYVGGKNNLYSRDDEIKGVISSGIISYGINKQLIQELKSIKRRERLGFLNKLSLRELQNILVRLGYTSNDFGTKEGKKRVLEEITSADKLDKILENEELCK